MKSRKKLSSFVLYCLDHPKQSFWQALVNWSKYTQILGRKGNGVYFNHEFYEDILYKEGK